MRIALFALLALVFAGAAEPEQRSAEERITAVETKIAGIESTLLRIEQKLDRDEQSSSASRADFGDRTLELLVLGLIGLDKGMYWWRRKNGTWNGQAH